MIIHRHGQPYFVLQNFSLSSISLVLIDNVRGKEDLSRRAIRPEVTLLVSLSSHVNATTNNTQTKVNLNLKLHVYFDQDTQLKLI